MFLMCTLLGLIENYQQSVFILDHQSTVVNTIFPLISSLNFFPQIEGLSQHQEWVDQASRSGWTKIMKGVHTNQYVGFKTSFCNYISSFLKFNSFILWFYSRLSLELQLLICWLTGYLQKCFCMKIRAVFFNFDKICQQATIY